MKTKNIAILVGNIYSAYTNDFLFGAEKAASLNNVNLIQFMGPPSNCFPSQTNKISTTDDNILNLNKVFDYSVISGADAIIVAYETLHFYMQPEKINNVLSRFSNIPIVTIGKKYENHACIKTDNYTGIKKCIEHIINHHNRRHICYISGPMSSNDSVARLAAYKEIMEENGIKVTDEMICYGDYSMESSNAIGTLIDNNPGIDAIISANDTMALAAYNECKKRGIEIGKDISITGFDNIESSKSVSPSLTTVEQNIILLGIKSIETAILAIDGGSCEDITIPTDIILRESCGTNHKHLKEQYFLPFLSLEENISHSAQLFEQNILKKDYMYPDAHSKNYIESIVTYITDIYYDESKSEYSIYGIKEPLDRLIALSEYNISDFSLELTYLISCILFTKNTLEKRIQLSQFINQIQDYMLHKKNILLQKKFNILQSNLWNIPMLIGNVTDTAISEKNIFLSFTNTLLSMYIEKGYIFLNKKPALSTGSESICPDSLELVTEFNKKETRYYNKGERMEVSKDKPLFDIIDIKPGHTVGVCNIYNDNMSYGILVCEMKSIDINSIYCASFQIGTALYLHGINKEHN